jgi:hypothetical protein
MCRYCSKTAQKLDWRRGHKYECRALQRHCGPTPPATVRLASRLIWMRRDQLHSRGAGDPLRSSAQEGAGDCIAASQQSFWGTVASVDTLVDHWDEWPERSKLLYSQIAVLVRSLVSKCDDDRDDTSPAAPAVGGAEIARLLARLDCNAHTVCDSELRTLGVGLFPLAAMLNHECRFGALGDALIKLSHRW